MNLLESYIESIENPRTKRNAKNTLRQFFILVLGAKKDVSEFVVYAQKDEYSGKIDASILEKNVNIISEFLAKYKIDDNILKELLIIERKNANRIRVTARLEGSMRVNKKAGRILNVKVSEKDVEEICVRDIDYYLTEFKKQYRKKFSCEPEKSTISKNISCIRTFFTYLESRDYIENNPVIDEFSKRYRFKPKIISLSLEDSKKLISVSDNPRDKAIILTFLSSGLRCSELCDLRISCIDFENNIIKVENGKGEKERYTQFCEKCKKAISDWVDVRSFCNPKSDLLFVTRNGRKLDGSRINKILHVFGKKANIKLNNSNGKRTNVHAHLLRHTYATQYLKAGGNIKVLQENLGHSSLEMTQQYIDINKKFKMQDYASTMSNLF